MSITETEDIYRLYHREWVIVHTTATMTGDPEAGDPEAGEPGFSCLQAAQQWATQNLDGRVPIKGIEIVLNTDSQNRFWAHVMVFKENLKGEFRHPTAAEVYAEAQHFEEFVVVPRNSKADHVIRAYGITKL